MWNARVPARADDFRKRGAPCRVWPQAPDDQCPQSRRHVAQAGLSLLVVGRARGENGPLRRLAGRGIHQHRAEGVNVTLPGHLPAGEVLRRHVVDRAEQLVGGCHARPVQGPGNPEIDDPGPGDGQDHVGRLEIAVDDVPGVDVT